MRFVYCVCVCVCVCVCGGWTHRKYRINLNTVFEKTYTTTLLAVGKLLTKVEKADSVVGNNGSVRRCYQTRLA